MYSAPLDFCVACGFLQVRDPHWLAQAYDKAITALDTGLVARNLRIAAVLEGLLPALEHGAKHGTPIFDNARCDSKSMGSGRWLDHGGGVGLLVRLMRDRGFDFRWADAHAENLLARGFELEPGEGCLAVTAIEVLEHLEHPLDAISQALADAGSRTLIFTTELYTGEPPRDWWYYAEEAGQHIAFYRHDTLVAIAGRLGLTLHSHRGLHMLTDSAITPFAFRWRVGRYGRLLARLRRHKRPSLIMTDHAALLAWMRGEGEAPPP